MKRETRRSILMQIGAAILAAPAVFSSRNAAAQLPPLPSLPAQDALLLHPGDAHFSDYQASFNARTTLTPRLRALCKTGQRRHRHGRLVPQQRPAVRDTQRRPLL
jgi:hypothetical protein